MEFIMISLVRLKARYLQSGNLIIFILLLLVSVMMVLCVNLLPLIYEKLVSPPVKENLPRQSSTIDFFVSFFLVLFAITVFFALSSSVTRCFYKRASNEEIKADDLFYYFALKRVFVNICFRLKLAALKLSGTVLFSLPFACSCAFLYRSAKRGVSVQVSIVMLLITVAFLLVGVLFFSEFSSLLFLCPYLFLSGERLSFKNTVLRSIRLMKNKKAWLRKIKLSFGGWFLLCAFIFPVGYVWSYYRQTLAVAAVSVMKE